MNFTRTVTIELEVYQSMENRLKKMDEESALFVSAVNDLKDLEANNTQLFTRVIDMKEKIAELEADNKRLMREVESLQVQHRNDQGLD